MSRGGEVPNLCAALVCEAKDKRVQPSEDSALTLCYFCYMQTISHRVLRNESAAVLRRVAAGESFQITNHGEVVATLAPVQAQDELARARAAGETVSSTRKRPLSSITRLKAESSVEILRDLRGDR